MDQHEVLATFVCICIERSSSKYQACKGTMQNELVTVYLSAYSPTLHCCSFALGDRLVGLVARRPPRERKAPGSNPACAGIFSWSSHTSDFKIGTPGATLPGAWRYRVSTGTGRPGVSILWLGEVERLICNFCLSVAARKIVWADSSLRYTSLLLGR